MKKIIATTIMFGFLFANAANAVMHGLKPGTSDFEQANQRWLPQEQTLERPLVKIAREIDNVHTRPNVVMASVYAHHLQGIIRDFAKKYFRRRANIANLPDQATQYAHSILLYTKLMLEHTFYPHYQRYSQEEAPAQTAIYLCHHLNRITSQSRLAQQQHIPNNLQLHAHLYRAMIISDVYNRDFWHDRSPHTFDEAWQDLQQAKKMSVNCTHTVSLLEAFLILKRDFRPTLPNDENPIAYASNALKAFDAPRTHCSSDNPLNANAVEAISHELPSTAGHVLYAPQMRHHHAEIGFELSAVLSQKQRQLRHQDRRTLSPQSISSAEEEPTIVETDGRHEREHTHEEEAVDVMIELPENALEEAPARDDTDHPAKRVEIDRSASETESRLSATPSTAPMSFSDQEYESIASVQAAAAEVPVMLEEATAAVQANNKQTAGTAHTSSYRGTKRSASYSANSSRLQPLTQEVQALQQRHPFWDAESIASALKAPIRDVLAAMYPAVQLTPEMRDKIKKLLSEGCEPEEVAHNLGVGYYQVSQIAKARSR